MIFGLVVLAFFSGIFIGGLMCINQLQDEIESGIITLHGVAYTVEKYIKHGSAVKVEGEK